MSRRETKSKHGNPDRYEARYESSGPQPDFHRLEKFQSIDFQYILPDNKAAELSAIWKTSIAGKNFIIQKIIQAKVEKLI